MHLHLLDAHGLLVANTDLILAGKVTHGIGTVVKILIGFGIFIGVVAAVLVSSVIRRR